MISFVKRNFGKIFFLLIYFFILYSNTFHEEYPDEYDNILGGKYIVQGILPYSGFFSHHGPVAYFLSAIMYLFSGSSFVKFRIIYSIFLFLYSLGIYKYIKKSIGAVETKFYLYFMFILGIASTYFWGHMLIADNLSAYLFVPVLALLVLKVVYKKVITVSDLVFSSILLSLCLLTALTTIYLVAFAYLFLFYLYFREMHFKISVKKIINLFLITFIPYAAFASYLFITGSFQDYIYQNFVLNAKYYVYNAPISPSGTINPIRYAIVIFHNFYFNFTNLLFQVKDFNFPFPFNITLALSNLALITYFFLRKHYALSLFFILSLVFSNVRSSPLDSSERDYQAAVYIVISIFSMCLFISKAFGDLKHEAEYGKRLILSVLLIFVGTYSFFNMVYLFGKYQEKVYTKYMGTASLIYDRPDLAPLINKIVGPNDYVWVGPLAFKDYLYVNAKIASKYHFLIPAMGRSEKIKSEIIAEFMKNKPKIIFFDKGYSILGSRPEEYADFFISYLKDNYITLYGKYASVIPVSRDVDLETKMYINKNKVDEVVAKLLSENLMRESPKK